MFRLNGIADTTVLVRRVSTVYNFVITSTTRSDGNATRSSRVVGKPAARKYRSVPGLLTWQNSRGLLCESGAGRRPLCGTDDEGEVPFINGRTGMNGLKVEMGNETALVASLKVYTVIFDFVYFTKCHFVCERPSNTQLAATNIFLQQHTVYLFFYCTWFLSVFYLLVVGEGDLNQQR